MKNKGRRANMASPTFLALISEGIAGATGHQVDEVERVLRIALTVAGATPEQLDQRCPPADVPIIRAGFAANPAKVRAWLEEGAQRARSGQGVASPQLLQRLRTALALDEQRN